MPDPKMTMEKMQTDTLPNKAKADSFMIESLNKKEKAEKAEKLGKTLLSLPTKKADAPRPFGAAKKSFEEAKTLRSESTKDSINALKNSLPGSIINAKLKKITNKA